MSDPKEDESPEGADSTFAGDSKGAAEAAAEKPAPTRTAEKPASVANEAAPVAKEPVAKQGAPGANEAAANEPAANEAAPVANEPAANEAAPVAEVPASAEGIAAPEPVAPAPFDDDALRRLVRRAMAEEPAVGDKAVPLLTASDPAAQDPTPPEPDSDAEELAPDAVEDVAIQSLLRKSMVERSPVVVPDLVSGVQKKLRKRSRGKFYADGWSTATSRTSYALVAVAMLLVVAIAYVILGPTGISAR